MVTLPDDVRERHPATSAPLPRTARYAQFTPPCQQDRKMAMHASNPSLRAESVQPDVPLFTPASLTRRNVLVTTTGLVATSAVGASSLVGSAGAASLFSSGAHQKGKTMSSIT